MRIGIIGASGKSGNLILKEAIARGHEVTAIVRNQTKLTDKNVSIIEKDIFSLTSDDIQEFDVVVNAFGAPYGEEEMHVEAGHVLIEALKGTNVRAIIIGGAGSLYTDESHTARVIDSLPEAAKPTSRGQLRNLKELQETSDITWTFISPSLIYDPTGKRTGDYREGKDHLLYNSEGKSYISYADYAIAVLDEIEQPKHINERFTVVGESE